MEQVVIVGATKEFVETHWATIRRGIVEIRKKMGDTRVYWQPEHIRDALISGQANLWGAMLGDRLVGFTVTQELIDPFARVPTHLFVWLGWRDSTCSTVHDGPFRMAAFLEDLGRIRGLAYLECGTPHKKVAEHFEKFGWERELYVMRKELYPREERL